MRPVKPSRRHHAIALGLVAAALAFLVSRNPRTPPELPGMQPSGTTRNAPVPGRSYSSRGPTMRSTETPSPSLSRLVPTRDQLREEVRANPAVPPPSLLQFSRELARRTDAVLAGHSNEANAESAASLMNEIDACARSQNAAAAAQALCLRNADRLAERFPELRARRDDVVASSSDDARKLYRSISRLRTQG